MTTDTKLTALQRIHDMAERPTCICGVPTGTAAIKTCAAAALAAEPVPSDSDRLEWTIEDNAKKAIEIADLRRDQRRIALDVIEAAAKECEQESTGDGITGTYQASWGRYLAGAVRALNVDEIIGRKP